LYSVHFTELGMDGHWISNRLYKFSYYLAKSGSSRISHITRDRIKNSSLLQ